MAKTSDKTLVVLRFSALGDVAMCIPVLLALRQHYPKINLVFITKSRFVPLVAEIPDIQVIPLENEKGKAGIARLLELGSHISRIKPAGVADLHNVLRTKLLRLMPGSWLMSWKHLQKGRKEKANLTRAKNKIFKPLLSGHERSANVFRKLGYSLELNPDNVLPTRDFPKGFGDNLQAVNLIGLAPFAAHEGKSYPPALVEELLKLLSRESHHKILLFGGGQREAKLFAQWESEFSQAISMAGRFTLAEELAVISNLDLMISMDSGNGHLAAMYGVPVVTIWGVTHPYAGFKPFGQPEGNSLTADRKQFPAVPTSVYGNTYPKGYDLAIASVSPEQIATKVFELLKQ